MIRIPELTYLIPNEIAAIKSINCPNVIRYLGDEQTETNIYIVMEYCEGGDLARVLQ
jgi:serine/threonine protein kinase